MIERTRKGLGEAQRAFEQLTDAATPLWPKLNRDSQQNDHTTTPGTFLNPIL
jgi:hypothetical protein